MEKVLRKTKNVMLVILLVFVVAIIGLIGISVLVSNLSGDAGPKQSFAIYNSGEKTVSVTFQKQKEDKTFGGYKENILVKPGETKCDLYSAGTYKVSVWDGNVEDNNTQLMRSMELKVVSSNGKENNSVIYIDTVGSSYFALVNVNFIYSGSELANNISKSFGTMKERPVLKKLYNSKKPMMIPSKVVREKLIGPSDKLPKEINSSDSVYALVPFPNTVKTKDEIYNYVLRFIESH